MKRLVRSAFDPNPRAISTKSLALLVGMLLSGIGVSVHEYLGSLRVLERPAVPYPGALERCTRVERDSWSPDPPCEPRTSELSAPLDDLPCSSQSGSATVVPPAAPTQWLPEAESWNAPTVNGAQSTSER